MGILKSLISGLAGATALTVVHQFLKKNVADAPRMDKLGRQALKRSLTSAGINLPSRAGLQRYALLADLICNTLYYSTVGIRPKSAITTGAALGLTAGAGAVSLLNTLGLSRRHAAKTDRTKAMTIGLYATGGIVAGIVAKLLDRKR